MFPQYLFFPFVFLKIRSKCPLNHCGFQLPCFFAYHFKFFIDWSLNTDIKIYAIFLCSGHAVTPLS